MIRTPEISEADWALLEGLRDAVASRLGAGAGPDCGRNRAGGRIGSACLDGWTRRTATSKIALLRSRGLILDDEFSRFSEATRKTVQFLVNPE